MTRTTRSASVLVLVTAFLLAASGANAVIKNPPIYDQPADAGPAPLGEPEPQFPTGVQWSLATVNGKPVGGDSPSFTLDDKFRATGFSGCNTYSMTLYPVRNQKLASGSIAMTHKQCDKEVMLLEQNFLVLLHSLPVWSIDAGDLVVKGGAMSLRFRRGL